MGTLEMNSKMVVVVVGLALIYFLNLVQKEKSLLRKPDSPY